MTATQKEAVRAKRAGETVTPLMRKVLDAVLGGAMTPGEVSTRVGAHRNTCACYMREWVSRGRLKKVGRDVFLPMVRKRGTSPNPPKDYWFTRYCD